MHTVQDHDKKQEQIAEDKRNKQNARRQMKLDIREKLQKIEDLSATLEKLAEEAKEAEKQCAEDKK